MNEKHQAKYRINWILMQIHGHVPLWSKYEPLLHQINGYTMSSVLFSAKNVKTFMIPFISYLHFCLSPSTRQFQV